MTLLCLYEANYQVDRLPLNKFYFNLFKAKNVTPMIPEVMGDVLEVENDNSVS